MWVHEVIVIALRPVMRVPQIVAAKRTRAEKRSGSATAHAKILLYPNGSQLWAFTPLRGVLQAVYL